MNDEKCGNSKGQFAVRTDLLNDYVEWEHVNPGYSLADYIRPELKVDHLIAVATILSPKLTKFQGGLFLDDGFDSTRFDVWFREAHGNLTAVERMLNHRHIRNISQELNSAPFELVLNVGQIVKCSLEAWLRYVHPEINTRVEMTCSDDDVEVTFMTLRTLQRSGDSV